MKRTHIFLFIVFFAALMLASLITGIRQSAYGRPLSIAAQAGLGLSLILFFLVGDKKKTGPRQ